MMTAWSGSGTSAFWNLIAWVGSREMLVPLLTMWFSEPEVPSHGGPLWK